EAIRTYTLHMADLVRKIIKIILASLDLDMETFYHSDFENFTASLRINHYEPKEISIGEEILTAHSDIGCLTILHQDNEGGLQIRSREGKWLRVNPIPNSFVINIGDCMKVNNFFSQCFVVHGIECFSDVEKSSGLIAGMDKREVSQRKASVYF
ncbi:hypothetical protein KI387_042237, partial [Taxus chinensis]